MNLWRLATWPAGIQSMDMREVSKWTREPG
ncbi:putative protein OS=Sphingobium scionense OX=1404341 GN=GGQ90_005199 PE=4 SV=1 [Sphingobium scionense]|uniref:Uncharacterized protein n=1 Tax=Sphingobium scionense TaxID=1404341 RepID=A0A7W6LXM1_9SPHN|nr:hypothetical protein [Sphingobium scionense]